MLYSTEILYRILEIFLVCFKNQSKKKTKQRKDSFALLSKELLDILYVAHSIDAVIKRKLSGANAELKTPTRLMRARNTFALRLRNIPT